MSLAKVHLVDSDVPLKEGENAIANCGKKVPRAVFRFMWDSVGIGGSFAFDQTTVCKRCQELSDAKQYLYGIIPGEESLHADSAA